jgi:hypothetical protein
VDTPPAGTVCLFCGNAAEAPIYPVRPYRDSIPNEGGTAMMVAVPAWVCFECVRRHTRREIELGWCDGCRAWGNAFDVSPCGERFTVA